MNSKKVYWDLKFGLHISGKDCKHMFENMFFKLKRYGLVPTLS